MSDEDEKYLKFIKKERPSFEAFSQMTQILAKTHEKIDQLLDKIHDVLLKTSKTTV